MSARSVDEINISNVNPTGATIEVDQYSFDIQVKWTSHDGSKHQHSDTYVWPNVLSDVPNNVVKEFMQEMVIAKVRVALGIDEWENYG